MRGQRICVLAVGIRERGVHRKVLDARHILDGVVLSLGQDIRAITDSRFVELASKVWQLGFYSMSRSFCFGIRRDRARLTSPPDFLPQLLLLRGCC